MKPPPYRPSTLVYRIPAEAVERATEDRGGCYGFCAGRTSAGQKLLISRNGSHSRKPILPHEPGAKEEEGEPAGGAPISPLLSNIYHAAVHPWAGECWATPEASVRGIVNYADDFVCRGKARIGVAPL